MAKTAVRRDDFRSRSLPQVCAATGRRADGWSEVTFDSTPEWTWILLLFGFFPFLIATFFARERVKGELPFTMAALDRFRRLGRLSGGLALAGLVALMLSIGQGRPQILVIAGVGLLLVAAGVAAWRGFTFPDGRPDDTGDWVVLTHVSPDFARAIEHHYDVGPLLR